MKCPNCGYDVPRKIKKVLPPENEPLSPWGYFGYKLLFGIPIAGLVLLIVFSCGGGRNVNLKNFARSYWCDMLFGVIIALVIVLIVLFCGIAISEMPSDTIFNWILENQMY